MTPAKLLICMSRARPMWISLKKLIDAIQAQRSKLNQQLDDISKLLKDLNQAEADCIEALKSNGNP